MGERQRHADVNAAKYDLDFNSQTFQELQIT